MQNLIKIDEWKESYFAIRYNNNGKIIIIIIIKTKHRDKVEMIDAGTGEE